MADYIREEAVARSTGATVQLLDLTAPGSEFEPELDRDGNVECRWANVCVDHGFIVTHRTLEAARSFRSAPEEWCDGCRDHHRKTGEPS